MIQDYPPSPSLPGENYECQCARCGSSCDWQRCEECEDGYDGHDCGEDCCMCLYPEENVLCQICRGHEGWYVCLSSPEWCKANPLPGREGIERGEIEWFAVQPTKGETPDAR